MTKLELAKFIAKKTGTEDPDDITSTTSPSTDYQADIIEALDSVWEEIQLMHEGVWHWRREQQTVATVAGTRVYSFATIDADCVGIIPFNTHPRGDSYILIGQNEVKFVPYQSWRGWMDRGDRSSQRPQYFTVRHDGGSSIEFDPTPDDAYTVELDILHDVQTLAADGDIPNMPARFHRLIGYAAAVELLEYDESVRFRLVSKRYKRWLNDLRLDQLPKQLFTVRPIGT